MRGLEERLIRLEALVASSASTDWVANQDSGAAANIHPPASSFERARFVGPETGAK